MIIEIFSTAILLTHLGLIALLIVILPDHFLEFSKVSILKDRILGLLENYYGLIAFVISFTAVTGSLYMSKIAGMPACELCWYQRILIFPTVILIGVALFLEKEDLADYIIPLMVIGLPISIYHYIVQMTEVSTGCSTAVSCSTTQVLEYRYISIPMMSITFFLVMILLLMFEYRKE